MLLPSLVLKLPEPSRLKMGSSVAIMSPVGRQGFWGGRWSVIYLAILATHWALCTAACCRVLS